jgi:hypothetical protein
MIVLKEQATPQTLKFIPRDYTATKVTLTDEQTNTSVDISGTFTQDKYYLKADLIFSLKVGRFYNIVVYNGSEEVYRDKVFCTNQTIDDYSINNNEYKEHSTTNDFIVL